MPIIIVLMAPKSGIIRYKALETDTNSFVKSTQKNLTAAEKLEWTPVLGSSGLGSSIIEWMASIASKDTFDIFTYWSSGLVNLLAPSGGGQWALQGPLQVPAGLKLGVEPATIAMAVGWGDA